MSDNVVLTLVSLIEFHCDHVNVRFGIVSEGRAEFLPGFGTAKNVGLIFSNTVPCIVHTSCLLVSTVNTVQKVTFIPHGDVKSFRVVAYMTDGVKVLCMRGNVADCRAMAVEVDFVGL